MPKYFTETDLAALKVLRAHMRESMPKALSSGMPITPTMLMYKAAPNGDLMEMPVPMKSGTKKEDMKATMVAFLTASKADAYALVEAMWTVPGVSAADMASIAMYRMGGGKVRDWPGAEERVFVLFQGRGAWKMMFSQVQRVPGAVRLTEPQDVEDESDVVRFGAGTPVQELTGLAGIGA